MIKEQKEILYLISTQQLIKITNNMVIMIIKVYYRVNRNNFKIQIINIINNKEINKIKIILIIIVINEMIIPMEEEIKFNI